MLADNIKEQINRQLGSILKDNPLQDINGNIKAIIMAVLNKLDIVTREEFDTQQKVLLATRQKLEELEEQVKQLSAK
jgi:BMFP domain-containing protein YqiC